MIQEQYVSLKVAKLAKEKGFNESISTLYKNGIFKHHKPRHSNNPFISNKGMTDNCCSAPTQSLLAKWLREKYEIHVEVVFWYYKDSHYCEYTYNITKPLENLTNNVLWFDNYEEAMEEGLKEALKLI